MTYTTLAIISVFVVVGLDLFVFKTKLITRKGYWTAYAIILFFQLITNWWLTSRGILTYNEKFILGYRVASAPVEDLLFGYSLVTQTMIFWIFWGRKGIQKD
jgi:lycopene cyclase domain-containing protein